MRLRFCILLLVIFPALMVAQQLAVARDTLCVLENGKVLKMPWANGINYSNLSNVDLNYDGIKDLVLYDRLNHLNMGRFRCFIKSGAPGSSTYSFAPELGNYFPTVYNWAVLLDYNCDGKEDLFCSTNSGIKVYRNEGSLSNPVNFVLVTSLVMSDYNPGGPPFYGNIYASTLGVPGIADIDHDGDLDIIAFSSQGYMIEYHKNLSLETYGNCDSLKYEYQDDCWGKFAESFCSIALNQCLPSPPRQVQILGEDGKVYHAGSCLTCLDSDNDGDQDLLMGDISCNNIQYAHNTGTAAQAYIGDTTGLYPNFPNKNNTLQIRINSFPCAYYVDVDGDLKKDLVATPSAFGSENTASVWYYRNTSSTNTVNFQFVKKNLLQDEMIEVGQNAFPVIFDENADGKSDLLIGTYGFYETNTLVSRLTLYRNIGTLAQPSYSLITHNYAGLEALGLNHLMPCTGDVDGDGDIDLLVGTSSGQVHWLENTAGAGQACNFSVFKNNPFGFTTVSAEAAPQLFDINQDGKLDLLIGMKNGRIAYYRNTGTLSVPAFSLVTNTLGNVDTRDNMGTYWIDGYAVPYFYKEGSQVKLLAGTLFGTIMLYQVPSDITQNFQLLNPTVNNYNEGAQSAPCFTDVNGDGKRDLFIGNSGGGLSFFSSASPYVGLQGNLSNPAKVRVTVFPSPAREKLKIRIDDLDFSEAVMELMDLSGRVLKRYELYPADNELNLDGLGTGLYLGRIHIKIGGQDWQIGRKILINK
ncbi:MAG TPA: FG-GAP-like repeat-containing protein [Bacteroidia bacterium]|nr:FG-GAP-like repeat-containing protein [Bacteroidia bacterium]